MTTFLLSLYYLNRVVVKAHGLTVPDGESAFSVNSDSRLDKLDEWWVYSVVYKDSRQGENNKIQPNSVLERAVCLKSPKIPVFGI